MPRLFHPSLLLLVFTACSAVAASYGSQQDIDYAATLWRMMEKAHLVGEGAVLAKPDQGALPHGYYIDTLETRMTLDEHSGRLIITRNYGDEGVTRSQVVNAPMNQLKSISVMYKREAGYDKGNKDWFWGQYSPAGEVLKDAQGVPMAGRVAAGSSSGCIACHRAAPGGDYVYSNDRGVEVATKP
jgi:hypothetical protein